MWPTVSIVFLVYNRCQELRESLHRMLAGSDYLGPVEVIVIDNASTDGSAAMIADEFPEVQLIVRTENAGVSGWNDGFTIATGDYVLALDDDCYLEADGLSRAVRAAQARRADLVSFAVTSSADRGYRFTEDNYRTGLLSFWGCAVLMRRAVLEDLGGYDPEIFVWANELEFMLRFFDRGFRHLHLPELEAVHMKSTDTNYRESVGSRQYRVNARHFAYIAAKLLRPRDAIGAFVARLAGHMRDAVRVNPAALKALPQCVAGFFHGLRHREPVVNPEVSRVYRRNFTTFASPWWVSRSMTEFLGSGADPGRRRAQYFADRGRYYPTTAETLEF